MRDLLALALGVLMVACPIGTAWPQEGPARPEEAPRPGVSPLSPRATRQRPVARPAQDPPPGSLSVDSVRKLRDAQSLARLGKYDQALTVLGMIDEPAAAPHVVGLKGTCLRKLGRIDEAIDLYRDEAQARAARGEDPMPMWAELERALREGKRLEEALDVCLEVRRNAGAETDWVRDEMESLIQADGLGERALPPLRREIESRPQDAELRNLLIAALFFLGRTEESLLEARALDSARKAHGTVLLRHLRLLEEKAMREPAVAAADAAIAEGLAGADLQEALLLRARALRRLHRSLEAADAFQAAADAAPKGPLVQVALRDRAALFVREMGDLDRGAAAYEALIASLEKDRSSESGRLLAQARVALADVRLRMGRYEDAGAVLRVVEERASDPTSREEAAFEQAEILFYAGKTEEASAEYGRIVKEFAGGQKVNDALERMLLLTRAAEAGPVPLAALGQVAYQRRVGAHERALEICHEAADACGDCAAAEDLLQQQALVLLDLGRLEEAATVADTLATRHADGAAAPKVLRAVADRMRERDGDTEAVLHRYEDLLIRFPTSHDAFEVRSILEKLRRTGEMMTPNGAGRWEG
jgi:tetratricopeptide (TPR) repeat protein